MTIDIDALEKAAKNASEEQWQNGDHPSVGMAVLSPETLLALIAVVKAAKAWDSCISQDLADKVIDDLCDSLKPFTTEPKG